MSSPWIKMDNENVFSLLLLSIWKYRFTFPLTSLDPEGEAWDYICPCRTSRTTSHHHLKRLLHPLLFLSMYHTQVQSVCTGCHRTWHPPCCWVLEGLSLDFHLKHEETCFVYKYALYATVNTRVCWKETIPIPFSQPLKYSSGSILQQL